MSRWDVDPADPLDALQRIGRRERSGPTRDQMRAAAQVALAEGWSLEQIGREWGWSKQRVHNLVTTG